MLSYNYFNQLSYIAQKRYLTKLNIDGCIIEDPYSSEESLWSEDMTKWPDLQFGDTLLIQKDATQKKV